MPVGSACDPSVIRLCTSRGHPRGRNLQGSVGRVLQKFQSRQWAMRTPFGLPVESRGVVQERGRVTLHWLLGTLLEARPKSGRQPQYAGPPRSCSLSMTRMVARAEAGRGCPAGAPPMTSFGQHAGGGAIRHRIGRAPCRENWRTKQTMGACLDIPEKALRTTSRHLWAGDGDEWSSPLTVLPQLPRTGDLMES